MTNAFVVETGGEELPTFVLGDLALRLIAPYLLIERVQKLLTGGGSGEGGAIVERTTETAEVEHAFRGAVKWHAHPIEQVDDAGRHVAHRFDGWLVGEEVAAVNRVVKVLPGGVALAFEVLGGVDSSLSADRV